MVKFIVGFVLATVVISAGAVTPEELRLEAGDSQRDQRRRDVRIDPNNLNSLIPSFDSPIEVGLPVYEAERNEENNLNISPDKKPMQPIKLEIKVTNPDKPIKASKYGKINKKERHNTKKRKMNRDDFIYVPPSRKAQRGGKSSFVSDAVKIKQKNFGIRKGSWIEAELARETTNNDPGDIEFTVLRDVKGDHGILPAQTTLFAGKKYNKGTNRLDLIVHYAILPDGKEITLSGIVYDLQKQAGLVGIIEDNSLKNSGRGLERGLLRGAGNALTSLAGGSVASDVVESTVDVISSDKISVLDQQKAQSYTIYVAKQNLFVQINKTF